MRAAHRPSIHFEGLLLGLRRQSEELPYRDGLAAGPEQSVRAAASSAGRACVRGHRAAGIAQQMRAPRRRQRRWRCRLQYGDLF